MRTALLVSVLTMFFVSATRPAHAKLTADETSEIQSAAVGVGLVGGIFGFFTGAVLGTIVTPIKDAWGGVKQSFNFKGDRVWKKPGAWILGLGLAASLASGMQPEGLPLVGPLIGKVGSYGTEIAPWVGNVFKVAATGPILWTGLRGAYGLGTGWLRGGWPAAKAGYAAGGLTAGIGKGVQLAFRRAAAQEKRSKQ